MLLRWSCTNHSLFKEINCLIVISISCLSFFYLISVKAEVIDKDTDNYSQRFIKRKMALLKHKRKHGKLLIWLPVLQKNVFFY